MTAVAAHTHPHSNGAHEPHRLEALDSGTPDYYAVLGISEDASGDEIRQAFRVQAKRWHPDLFINASPEERAQAERHMKAVIEAHTVLGDPVQRHEYERSRRETTSWHTDHTDHSHAFAYDPQHHDAGSRVERDSIYGEGDRRAVNTNGAGQALAVLCILLAVGIGAHLLAKGPAAGIWGMIQLGALFGLLALAWVLAQDDSVLARAANAYMEAEPRSARHAHPVPRPATHPPSHTGHTHPQATPEADGALDFGRLVDDALATVPEEFVSRMENVVVRVEEEPSEDDLRSGEVPPGYTLLGHYHGVPLTRQGVYATGPEVISIYRGPIERHCGHDPERIRKQVRATVLHELAHHFGIDHDDMPEWVK